MGTLFSKHNLDKSNLRHLVYSNLKQNLTNLKSFDFLIFIYIKQADF